MSGPFFVEDAGFGVFMVFEGDQDNQASYVGKRRTQILSDELPFALLQFGFPSFTYSATSQLCGSLQM